MSSNYIRKKQLKIAMIGHKVVPSRRGGIELVLTTMCPKMVKRGHQVTCYNRSGDKVENEYVNTVKNGTYKGVKLKKVLTINKKGLAAMTSSFSAAIRAAFGRYDIVHFHAEGPCTALWIGQEINGNLDLVQNISNLERKWLRNMQMKSLF